MLVIVLFTSILTACSNKSAEKQLSQAESLIIEQPDSTVAILVYMDTTNMSENQIARQQLLYLYTRLIYGNQLPLDSTGIAEGDKIFTGTFDENEVKWLIAKSAEAKRRGNPADRIELLKDAEFLAIQLNDNVDLGIIYLFLSNVYEQGFNGTVSKHYADKALAIFRELLKLEHENDILKIKTMQDNLFKSDCRNKDMSARISELFHTRFNLIDALATTYFECKDTAQEQKRIYSDVKSALSNFGTKEATQELTDIVNGYKNNLMANFHSDFPKIPPSQYRFALYLFCGFSLPSISIFTDTELRNIYIYKSRLKSMISKRESPRKDEYLGYFE